MKASIDRVFNRSRLYGKPGALGQLESGPGNLKGRASELHEFYDRPQTIRVFMNPLVQFFSRLVQLQATLTRRTFERLLKSRVLDVV